ncbi:MAG: glycoside hydrolase family 3 C-terminal domain-containing protein, partial [Spirochaetales bacterium]|nr:glycoside hydrolase family 3 C-terminal domain-containing protein [Spirochaetales bacterium]
CGRNFEYFSEDPYLAGEMAVGHINGVQSEGVGTSLKHFAANNQEANRMSVDTVVDERTLREIYLPAFETAVKKAQPWTVMCAYNKLNGTYASEHKWLLTDILKEEWGHEGLVVTDWGAINERVDALEAGLELEMPASSGINDAKIVAAVKAGEMDEAVLDRSVYRILDMIFKYVKTKEEREALDVEKVLAEDHEVAMKTALETFVLLKNEENQLPLKKEGTIAFIGAFAEKPRYQGGGSSHINPSRMDSALTEARNLLGDSAEILYAPGYDPASSDVDEALIEEAKEAARKADKAVLFIGLTDSFESEGFDRTHLGIPESHSRLVEEISAINPDVTVVLSNGSPIEMPWLNKVPAVLETYLGGQAWGGAVVRLLFGDANPSGKLPETFPLRLQDNTSHLNFPGDENTVEFREGIFVGYRGHDALEQEVLFPFGHGLSYTSFEYSDLKLSASEIDENDGLKVELTVTNTGSVAGKEIVQIYVRDEESSVQRPVKELKQFGKVELQPGEGRTLSFELDRRSFAFWHPRLSGWRVESGDFTILAGASSRDIRQTATVRVNAAPWTDVVYQRSTRLGQIKDHPVVGEKAKEMISFMSAQFSAPDMEEAERLMMESMIAEMPLKSVISFTAGQLLNEEQLVQMLETLNS